MLPCKDFLCKIFVSYSNCPPAAEDPLSESVRSAEKIIFQTALCWKHVGWKESMSKRFCVCPRSAAFLFTSPPITRSVINRRQPRGQEGTLFSPVPVMLHIYCITSKAATLNTAFNFPLLEELSLCLVQLNHSKFDFFNYCYFLRSFSARAASPG